MEQVELPLDDIGARTGTDKARRHHGYTLVYEQYLAPLRHRPIVLLEIGVGDGSSLRMWSQYLPNATIYGLDRDPVCASVPTGRAEVLIGDQSHPRFLRRILRRTGMLDVVIDDGSHVGDHQIRSFECLFPAVKEGGLYVVEDLHASYWGWGLRSAVAFFKGLVDAVMAYGRSEYADITNDPNYRRLRSQLGYFERAVESVHFYRGMVFIRKRGGPRQAPGADRAG